MFDAQLAKLREAAISNESPYAEWIYSAVADYIYRGKASPDFEKAFLSYKSEQFPEFIEKCLKNGLSDDEIIRTAKKVLKSKAKNFDRTK